MANFLNSTPLSGFFYDPTKDRKKAEEGLQEGQEAYRGLQVPDFQPVEYTGPSEAADVAAQQAALERVGPTAYGDIAVDPRLKAAQLSQLSALEELRNSGGMNAADRANLARISNEEAAKEQSQRAAIMQGAQARGTSTGGLSLMQMLQAQQSGANRQAQRDLDVAGMAQDRALQAGGMASSLAGNMSQQDFNQQAQIAAARDTANKFNAQMANQNSQFNVGNTLRADIQNQGKTQGVYDRLATAKMEQERQNKFVSPQAKFAAGATRAGGLAGAGRSTADYYGQREDTAKKAQSGLWGGAAGLAEQGLKSVPWGSMFGGDSGDPNAASRSGSTYQPRSTPAQDYVGSDSGGTDPSYSYPEYQPDPTDYVTKRKEQDPYQPYKGY
jgi:hypothetical protein